MRIVNDAVPKKGLHLTKRHYVLGLLIILIVLRLPTLFTQVLDVDEAIYSLFARIWFEGGAPYVDCVETKPLGIYLFYGAIFQFFGRYNIILVHLATTAIIGLTAYVIYLISTMLYSRRAGFWAALFYIVFSTTYIPKILATTIEPIMLLPISLQFYWWLRFERDHLKKYAYMSGIAFSAACLLKYQAGINIFIMIGYLLFIKPLFIRSVSIKEHFRGFGAFIIGAIPLPAMMMAYIIGKGAWEGFYFWNFLGSYAYIKGGASTMNFMRRIATRVLPFVASTILLWVMLAQRTFNLGKKLFGLSRRSQRSAHEWLIMLWFLLTIIPVSTGKRFYGHYFLLLLPPMSILCSRVADKIWNDSKKRWLKILMLFWIIVPAVGFSVPRYFLSDVNHAFHEDNPSDYKPLAEYVKKNTKPGDRVLAWGYAPLIYWYSERLPATRFFWSDVLTGRVPGLKRKPLPDTSIFATPGSWQMFFDDLKKHKPAYIIDTANANLHDYKDYPIYKYPKLQSYIDEHYFKEATINGVVFYRRR